MTKNLTTSDISRKYILNNDYVLGKFVDKLTKKIKVII